MQRTFTNVERRAYLGEVEASLFLEELPLNLTNPAYGNAKRTMDLVISLLVLTCVFSWLYPILWVLIKSTSKGPVLFKQLRHGQNNVPFYCYKFRTMYLNDDADRKQATKDDPRVTKIGAFLRRTSLDELPQILNVIKGEMSIVGPRPHPIYLNEQFSKEISNLMCRHIVKPGITGLAQAKGFRGETSNFAQMNSRCRLDLFYVKNWSLLLDAKIIVWTVWSVMVKRENAY